MDVIIITGSCNIWCSSTATVQGSCGSCTGGVCRLLTAGTVMDRAKVDKAKLGHAAYVWFCAV